MTLTPIAGQLPGIPPPRRRRSLSMGLAALAGAHPEVLAKAPTERVKHAAMGGVLLTTAGMAAVSAAFGLATAVRVPVVAAVVAGLLWGFVIFNLDRMLVVSMTRHGGWWRNVATVVPRVVLAVVIGAVISVPLVLQIFQPEIDAELVRLHVDNDIQAKAALTQQYAEIPADQKRVDELQAIASGNSQSAVDTDPDVAAAQKQVDSAQDAYNTAADAAQCELVGSCGTHTPGVGTAYREAKDRADQAEAELTDARNKLNVATAAAQTRIASGAESNKEAAQKELATLVPRLQQLEAERDAAQGDLTGSEDRSDGLLARLQALDGLSQRSPSMNGARQALFLLFLLIEVLPVLVKLLTLIGKPGLYDRILGKDEDLLETRASNEREVALQLEGHRVTEQIRLGKIANGQLVDVQAKIASKAIDVWGQVAMQRSDQALAQWYANYAGGSTSPSSTAVSAPMAVAPTTPRPNPPTGPAPTRPMPTPAAPASAPTMPTPRPSALPAASGAPQTYQQYRAARAGGSTGNGQHPTNPTTP